MHEGERRKNYILWATERYETPVARCAAPLVVGDQRMGGNCKKSAMEVDSVLLCDPMQV